MSHERSETVKTPKGWTNVYGKGTPLAGKKLPLERSFEREYYGTEPEASEAARKRSQAHGEQEQWEQGMKKAKYNSKLMSPKGDFVLYEESELHRAFPRPIKQAGKVPIPSKALPFTREKMVGDSPGLSVRKAEKDDVV